MQGSFCMAQHLVQKGFDLICQTFGYAKQCAGEQTLYAKKTARGFRIY